MKFFASCLRSKCLQIDQKKNKSNERIKDDDSKINPQKIKGSTDMSSMFDKSNGKNSLYFSANLDKVVSVAKLNSQTSGTSHVKRHWEEQDKILCLFCGGVRCKHENYQLHKSPAVIGLHSDFITQDIIASQRPSTVLINQFDLVNEFKKINIGLIVNLQREGEHPYCGPNKKLEDESGFAYNPFIFEEFNIKCRCEGWKEVSSPDTIQFILDIVKEMSTVTKIMNKKVFVHCHSGYGRTGVVICCYQLFTTILSASEIIDGIRKIRPGSLDKDYHYNFCVKFEKFISRARVIFTAMKKNLDYFIKNQNDLIYSEESILYRSVPKLFVFVFDRLIELKEKKLIRKEAIYQNFFHSSSWSQAQEESLFELKIKLNYAEWDSVKNDDQDPAVLCKLFYDWLGQCVKYVISPKTIDYIFDEKEMAILITNNINHAKLFTGENRRQLSEDIKSCLTEIEFETIACISYFLMLVSPDNEKEAIDYENMIVRMCASLLGFSFKTIWDNKNHLEVQGAIYYSQRLGKLVKFFIIVCELHLETDTHYEFSSYINKKKFNINGKINHKSSNLSNGYGHVNSSSEKNLNLNKYPSAIKSSAIPDKDKPKEIVYNDLIHIERKNEDPNNKEDLEEELKNINSLIFSHKISSNTELVEKPNTNSIYGSRLVAQELQNLVNNEILILKDNKKKKRKSSFNTNKLDDLIVELNYNPGIIKINSPSQTRKYSNKEPNNLSLVPESLSDEKDSNKASRASSSRKIIPSNQVSNLDKAKQSAIELFSRTVSSDGCDEQEVNDN